MSILKAKRKLKILIISTSVLLALAIFIVTCAIYLGDYYRAEEGAIAVFNDNENITLSVLDNGNVIFEPENATRGFIFYPGGKVEHRAYEPLLSELAREGILCVLIKMPFNLAVFDINAADGIRESFPEITRWYIGGHSLGSSMAASYLEKHADEFSGLVLLGSYSTADLSDSALRALCIHGSEDGVMNREKHDGYFANLPKGTLDIEIPGGCHAYFGMYGEQSGDGVATITAEEQIVITADYIESFIFGR
jgi:hypothetical protein